MKPMDAALSGIPAWALVALGVVVVVQLTLDVIALLDLYRRPSEQVIFGNKWIWVAIVLLVNTIGPIIYLLAGRRRDVVAVETFPSMPTTVRPGRVADTLYGSHEHPDPR
jgi:hypothetical protein